MEGAQREKEAEEEAESVDEGDFSIATELDEDIVWGERGLLSRRWESPNVNIGV